MEITEGVLQKNKKYLELLSKQFPTVQEASTEIINLQAILNLPKGTEHFLSDLHGEYEAFLHILKNGSGVLRKKIEDIFGSTITQNEKNMLATLIYYPEEVLKRRVDIVDEELNDWYEVILHRLVSVCRGVSSKYTRSKVRKALPKYYAYILEELLHEQENVPNKLEYYDQIIKTIVDIGQADPFIVALCELIQRLAIDRLHIIGDIYDRGPGPHIIMEKLINYHSVDIQWGNHDISWIGAAAGSKVCIANTIRICARYGNLDTLEDGYGINLMPLVKFAIETYTYVEDTFQPKKDRFNEKEAYMIAQIHKAIAIIMFKLEGQLINRNPNYEMENKLLLDKIDFKNNIIELNGKKYPINGEGLPTINAKDPYKLTTEEEDVMAKLKTSYLKNDKLQKHIKFMLAKGSIYLVFNNNLLYHGCIPLEDNGDFAKVKIGNREYSGRRLLDQMEKMLRKAYGERESIKDDNKDLDILWYLWTGKNSSMFGKKRMTTFERYFISDPITHKEEKNPYYKYNTEEETCKKILAEFGLLNNKSRIINGHVPVKVSKGESPVKANGRLIVIDGGLAKAYQKVTGIAGYTLIYNSHGMLLAAHEPFESADCAVEQDSDIVSKLTVVDVVSDRIRVADTDNGKELKQDIYELTMLLEAYRKGVIKQKIKKRW